MPGALLCVAEMLRAVLEMGLVCGVPAGWATEEQRERLWELVM